MEKNLAGKVALVTGSARGIGRGIASLLAQRGAHVVVSDIDGAAGHSTTAEIVAKGGKAIFLQADIGKAEQTEALINDAITAYGQIDILVNNAGIVSTAPLVDVSLDQWERLMAIDLTAVFLLSKAVLPGMTARKSGRIINIASVAGEVGGGLFGNSAYAAAKAAVIALTKGIAREAGPAGVTANAICPALTDTEMTGDMDPSLRAAAIAAMPLGRAGTPADIAEAVAFLASDAASFITGVTLNVDGGMMRR